MASRPQQIPAVYCRERSPDAVSRALVGPVRQVETAPTAAASSDQTPQAMVTTLIGASCRAARSTAMPCPFCTTSTVMASGTTSSIIAWVDQTGACHTGAASSSVRGRRAGVEPAGQRDRPPRRPAAPR